MTRVEVISSNVHSIGYDAVEQVLEVQYRAKNGEGAIYRYAPVSAELHEAIMRADSIGRAINVLIKTDGAISCERVYTTEVL